MQVVCSVCGPFSGHLYEKLTSKGLEGLTMKQDFCSTYFDACESQLGLESDYCDVHTLGGVDDYWSYPFTVGERMDIAALIPFTHYSPEMHVCADRDLDQDLQLWIYQVV